MVLVGKKEYIAIGICFLRPDMYHATKGTGHKVTARVGWSDLGWAMENLWAVSMGRQIFCMSPVGPPNKNPYMST